MNPVCRDEVSTRPAGADFTLRLHREINFILARRNNFSPGFYLDWYIFKKFLFGRMSVYENSSIQKQAPEAFSIQKTNLKNFAIFTENTCFGVILLTLSWQRPLSYRNQSTDLRSKSTDWFLYDNGLGHERVKNRLQRRFSCKCFKSFKNTYFEEHLRTTASVDSD